QARSATVISLGHLVEQAQVLADAVTASHQEWVAEQERIEAERVEQERLAAEQAERERLAAQQQQQQQQSGGNSSGGQTPSPSSSEPEPTGSSGYATNPDASSSSSGGGDYYSRAMAVLTRHGCGSVTLVLDHPGLDGNAGSAFWGQNTIGIASDQGARMPYVAAHECAHM